MCNKEKKLINDLVLLLGGDSFEVGMKLPSERDLAEQLSASRNTLRGALKTLVAHGAVEIRPGSGSFLLSKSALTSLGGSTDYEDEKKQISEQLEAFFLFEPEAVVLATKRITDKVKKQLEDCVVKMSHSILEVNIHNMTENHKEFHRIIALATGNRSIRHMLERLEITYLLVSKILIKITPEERNTIFARHVNLYKAIKSGDTAMAKKMSLQMILTTSLLLHRLEGIPLPDIISREIDDQIIDLKRKNINPDEQ